MYIRAEHNNKYIKKLWSNVPNFTNDEDDNDDDDIQMK